MSATLEKEIRDLGPWFHNLRIDGVETAPDHFLGDFPATKWERFKSALPEDLEGRSVLDIGCNGGFYSLRMKERGASRVVAIDSDPRYLRQADLAVRRSGYDIELHQMSVYDVRRLGEKFDLVLFLGVLYHLRHPLLALDLIHEHVAADMLLFQSLQRGAAEAIEQVEDYPFSETDVFDRADFPKLHFVEHRYAGDPTNWFIPNPAASEAMLRSAGFAVDATPDPEVYLCRRGPRPDFVDPPPRT